MTTYFVDNAGDNGAGTSWATAKTTLAAAIALPPVAGDVIKMSHTHTGDNATSADTTWSLPDGVSLVTCDKTTSPTDTPTVMGTGAWIGHDTVSAAMTLTSPGRAYVWGVTVRNGGTSLKVHVMGSTDGCALTLDNCYIWSGTTNAGGNIQFGSGSSGANIFVRLRSPTLRLGSTSQALGVRCPVEIVGGAVGAVGSVPGTLFSLSTGGPGAGVDSTGFDLSAVTGTLVSASSGTKATVTIRQSKLNAALTTKLATQSPANGAAGELYLLDCASGDTHGVNEYHNAMGALTNDATIYVTAGPASVNGAGASWKVVTTAVCSAMNPFITPWIPGYNSNVASSVTPYIEILRDGSATAYKDNEVWADFAAKVTSGSTLSTLYRNFPGVTAAGSNIAAGTGTGNWTGENATAWSGKITSGSAFTAAEIGDILARVNIGLTSGTVYIDPFWRT
jgi:hypothetical protein